MATVIDSLVIELGLDPKKLTKGQQEAVASFKRSQQQMMDTAKAVEEGARRVVEVMHKIRNEAVAFTAALVGATGIKEFFSNIIKTDADLGRLSRSLGISVEELSTWRGAIKLAGGSAADADAALDALVQQFNLMKIDPTQATAMLRFFRGLDINIDDIHLDKVGGLEKLIFRIAKHGEGKNLSLISTYFRQMGFPPGFVNALTQGEAGLRRYLAEAKRLAPTTQEDVDAARKFELAWDRLSMALTRFGHNLVTIWGPKIADLLDQLTEKAEVFAKLMGGMVAGAAVGSFIPGVGTIGGAAIGLAVTAATMKAGANGGPVSGGISVLTRTLLSEEPQLKQITALNDEFHKRTHSKHAKGLALDFTIKDPTQALAVVDRLKKRFDRMGISSFIQQEGYVGPLPPGATAPHIHVQFQSAADALKYYNQMGGAQAAVFGGANGKSSTSTSTSEVKIDTINVNAPHATDAKGIASGLGSAMEAEAAKRRRFMSMSAEGGPN